MPIYIDGQQTGNVDISDRAVRDLGKVDIAAFDVPLPAGTSNIGDVDVVTAPGTVTGAPVVGVKTVTAVAVEIFAGASVKANRRKLILKNEDQALRFRVGPSTLTQQNGFPVEPGAVTEFEFDPGTAVAIYAISEGASLDVAVMEV